MKKNIHPEEYRPVIFHDISSGERFLISSTVATEEEGTWKDGEKYPIVRIEVSSASHPFYTGKEQVIDTAGRVEKFKARLAEAQSRQTRLAEAKSKQAHAAKAKPALPKRSRGRPAPRRLATAGRGRSAPRSTSKSGKHKK